MSPIAVGLDLLLVVLLAIAVVIGLRLNKRLKGLRDGQDSFVRAVRELDVAAARAEAGLNALKAAQDQTHDGLLTRIETARGLITRLEAATTRASTLVPPSAAEASRGAASAMPSPRQAPPMREPEAARQSAPLRQPTFGRPSAQAPARPTGSPLRAQAPAFAPQALRPAAREIDDDLFEDEDRLTLRRSYRR